MKIIRCNGVRIDTGRKWIMTIRWEGPYPPVPPRRLAKASEAEEGNAGKRNAPGHRGSGAEFRRRLARWAGCWGPDLLLVWGAGSVCAGVGWIYPPAGLIAAGVMLIAGGVLWAKGGDGP